MTPTREEILEEATKIYMKRNWKISGNTPEEDELIEEGTYEEARNNLMRNEGSAAMDYLQEMASEAGYRLVKQKSNNFDEHVEKHVNIQICESGKFNIPFDVSEQEDSNTLIVGANKTGKTRLACAIASVLHNLGWRVIVFDNVGIWGEILSFPLHCQVKKKERHTKTEGVFVPVPSCSTIFDLSFLVASDQRNFVDSALEQIWNQQVKNSSKRTLCVFEEFQLFGRNVRGSAAQNILRIMSAGRNHNVRLLAIAVDLALIDCSFVRLCSQRYYGRLNVEENSKRKFRSYHGNDWCRIATELDLGYFIYMLRDSLKIVKVPLFEPQKKPQVLEVRTVKV